ncbi:hypothetical protein BDN70DRAFT_938227 [Pholiota conissans]|uniref:Uncharacterized protein n=1 Tax=Pholiota conissans TaxID=109636 RepID=A0A9P5YR24_9AGAR|nr:hypothetical protein BDN70DRAFT_938227 [Pholiota conissans]
MPHDQDKVYCPVRVSRISFTSLPLSPLPHRQQGNAKWMHDDERHPEATRRIHPADPAPPPANGPNKSEYIPPLLSRFFRARKYRLECATASAKPRAPIGALFTYVVQHPREPATPARLSTAPYTSRHPIRAYAGDSIPILLSHGSKNLNPAPPPPPTNPPYKGLG